MLAADTYMKLRIYWLAKFQRKLHQLADTCLVKFCKRIILEDFCIIISI